MIVVAASTIAALAGIITGILTSAMANRRPSELATLIATLSREIGRLDQRVQQLEDENAALKEKLDHVPKRSGDITAQEAAHHD